jgi:hypothetical protein
MALVCAYLGRALFLHQFLGITLLDTVILIGSYLLLGLEIHHFFCFLGF